MRYISTAAQDSCLRVCVAGGKGLGVNVHRGVPRMRRRLRTEENLTFKRWKKKKKLKGTPPVDIS